MTFYREASFEGFGYREQAIAARLLSALSRYGPCSCGIGDGVRVGFNTMSGCVFLTDEDRRVFMLRSGAPGDEHERLDEWLTCPSCESEEFGDELDIDWDNETCAHCREDDEDS